MKKDLAPNKFIQLAALTFTLLLAGRAPAQSVEPKDQPANNASAQVKQIKSLAESKDPEAASKIVASLSSADWYVRGEAARALGRLRSKAHVRDLFPLVEDKNWFVREAALSALSEIGETSVASSLKTSLESEDPFVRARAARSLGLLKEISATETLIKSLGDQHEIVRRAAAMALGEMRANAAVDPLITLLADSDPSVRRSAAVALGRIGDIRAADALLAATKAESTVDWEYAAALYRLGKTEHLDGVAAALHSDFADERNASLRALLEFADAGALSEIMSLAKNG
ncbi:MAG TPA: HEAT repeat domain-containing protein, partial [Blastocatellia bacterium]|nr:HEAT repeat domain-containing protein [Blastocatellia bacterium]